MLCKSFVEGGFWLEADKAADLCATLENEYGWNSGDAELASDVAVVVGGEFAHFDLAVVFGGEAVDGGCQATAWPTPWGPEIDQNGNGALVNLGSPV